MTSGESEHEPSRRRKLTAITIRWDEITHRIIREEAQEAGITVAQFVREAALIRAAVRSAARDAPGMQRDFRLIAEEVERLAAVRGNHESGK